MKRFLAFLLTLALSVTVFASSAAILPPEQIPVLTEDSAEASGLNKLDILRGTGNGFELERSITRAEAVVLLMRMHPENTGALGMPSPEFDDMYDHWAYKEVTAAKKMGLVDGTSDTTFTPDRTVSGREFTKMMLSLLGYSGITIENAYQLGEDCGLILNKFTRSVVYDDRALTRGDAARICWSALVAKTADNKLLYTKLIEAGKYEYNDFYGVLFVGDNAAVTETFSDKLNAQMPEDKNYMFSPLSVKLAFAMAANGASGETKSQIMAALDIADLDAYNNSTKALIEKYNESEILQLNIANSIWINNNETSQRFSAAFADRLNKYYNAEAYVRDKTIVNDINSWVNDKTNGKISNIINDDEFLAMLINAVYFKGTWQNEFSEGFTRPDTFTDRNGNAHQADFMNRTAYFDYYKHENCEIVELPYKTVSYNEETEEMKSYDLDISMYLVKGDFSEQVLSNNLSRTYVALSMPKFEFEFTAPLKEIMQSLGIENAFVEKTADFTEMFDSGNMFITDAVHKTYINVDEKGTEAAAVTAVMMGATSMPPQPVEVKFNEPFTFVIKDNSNGEILFLGEYAFVEEN